MDRDELIQRRILAFAYKHWEKHGPDADAPPYQELARWLGIDEEEMWKHIGVLEQIGTAHCDQVGGAPRITTKGLEVMARNRPLIMAALEPPGDRTININAPVVGSSINQGDGATVTAAISILDKLKVAIEHSNLPEKEKKGLLKSLKALSEHPLVVELIGSLLRAPLS